MPKCWRMGFAPLQELYGYVTPVTNAGTVTGFDFANGIDGKYDSIWRIAATHSGDITIVYEPRAGSPSTTHSDLVVGLFNHNLVTSGCTGVSLEASSDGISYTEIMETPLDDDSDVFIQARSQAWNESVWYRLSLQYTGTPSETVTVGQVHLAQLLDLETSPDKQWRKTPNAFANLFPMVGGHSYTAWGSGEPSYDYFLVFSNLSRAKRDEVNEAFKHSRGALFPIAIYSHEANDYAIPVGSTNTSLGSGLFGRFVDRPRFIEVDDGTWTVAINLRVADVAHSY